MLMGLVHFMSQNLIISIFSHILKAGPGRQDELETLDLGQNKIIHIKGLESLMNLKDLWLADNLIPQKILDQLGGLDSGGCAHDAMQFVKFSLINL